MITTTSFAEFDDKPLMLLRDAGLDVFMNPYGRKLKEEEAKELLADADYLIAGTEPLTRGVLVAAKRLRVISRCGTGMDNVDLDAAREFGIKVFNTPYGPTQAVAELTLALILDVLRKITFSDRNIRAGVWKKPMGNLFQGKSLGIIGLGKIGRAIVALTEPFRPSVRAYDLSPDEEYCWAKGVEICSLKELLSSSDIVSINVSSSGGRPMIGAGEIRLMRKTAVLVNTSRGEAIDEEALYGALKDGLIAGAATDVFQKEPYKGRLSELDNVVLTPHIGSYAMESRVSMEVESAENVVKAIAAL